MTAERSRDKVTGDAAKESEPVQTIERVIDGRIYTVKVHFRKDARRTAQETMKSILVHTVDDQTGSMGKSD